MRETRRTFIRYLTALGGVTTALARGQQSSSGSTGNFRYVYSDARLGAAFKDFLANVFHLYPQDDLHALIKRSVDALQTDERVYRQVQAELSSIKPWFADLRYSLPALSKQKKVLCEQTLSLLDSRRRYEGYLEIGSNGRFLDALEEPLDIVGPRLTMADVPPSFSPVDLVDRGQLPRPGIFVPLNDYRPPLAASLPEKGLELITVYIGLHHCPPSLRGPFLENLRTALKPGGVLIVRDHDVREADMSHMVGLAHDVFNLGTKQSWEYNAAERRHFYSLDHLDQMLAQAGFARQGDSLVQAGDPTRNTLRRYARR